MKDTRQLVGKPSKSQADTWKQYVSPKELAERWCCSRTTAQRIAERAGVAKYFLGEGRNGMVRYALTDIEAYEESRKVSART